MKWNNVKPDISAKCLTEISNGWSAIDIVSLISAVDEYPFVIFPDEIRERVITHLRTKNVELGGLLVGSVVSIDDLNDGVVAVIIEDAIQSHDCQSTSVSLHMNPAVWQQANKMSNDKTFVVGWYHSHPNLGAYFSGTDRKTQKDIFNSSYSLGLVIDPLRNEEKWFVGEESIEVNSEFVRNTLI